jgi:hypothetical protein
MAMKKCGKCAGCKKGMKCTKQWADSKADKKADKKTMQGLTPKAKAAFIKGDKEMDKKNPSEAEDKKKDAALAKKVSKKFPPKKK